MQQLLTKKKVWSSTLHAQWTLCTCWLPTTFTLPLHCKPEAECRPLSHTQLQLFPPLSTHQPISARIFRTTGEGATGHYSSAGPSYCVGGVTKHNWSAERRQIGPPWSPRKGRRRKRFHIAVQKLAAPTNPFCLLLPPGPGGPSYTIVLHQHVCMSRDVNGRHLWIVITILRMPMIRRAYCNGQRRRLFLWFVSFHFVCLFRFWFRLLSLPRSPVCRSVVACSIDTW